MKKQMIVILVLLFIPFGLIAQKITTGSLLKEMVNLDRLTNFPKSASTPISTKLSRQASHHWY